MATYGTICVRYRSDIVGHSNRISYLLTYRDWTSPLIHYDHSLTTICVVNVQQEQMEQTGNAESRSNDVTAVENRKSDDVTSLSSDGQTVSRDRHVAERMYVYY